MDVGQRSNLPSRPPASFKGTTAGASTVYEKKQNHNIAGLKLGKKTHTSEVNLGHTQSISNTKVCCVLFWNWHYILYVPSYLLVPFLLRIMTVCCGNSFLYFPGVC